MARLVERFVIIVRHLAVGFRRDDRDDICSFQPVPHPRIGVIAFVGEQYIGRDLFQQNVGAIQIAGRKRPV